MDRAATGDLVRFRNGVTVMVVVHVEGDVAYCKVYPRSTRDEPGVFVPFDLLVPAEGEDERPRFH